ncbi:MAG: hypothetical protein JXI32_07485 [Deltaproteobacteria bacterium]|nr:hypothetical protein [Deltaproteobacteria bacterium]
MKRLPYGSLCAVIVALSIVAAAAVAGAEDQFVPYQNKRFRFATVVPRSWVSELRNTKTTSARIFSGPERTETYYTTINFQVVIRKPGETVEDQAREIQKQWASAPRYKLIANDKGTLGGQPAVRLIAVYQAPGTNEMYGQEQYITVNGDYFYWIGYTAPGNLYDKYRPIMEQAINNFRFLP